MKTTRKDLSREYLEYIESDAWKRYRRRVLRAWGNKCAKCGADGKTTLLHVHHKTYERLGRERLEDCVPLCIPHHEQAFRRKLRAKIKRDTRQFLIDKLRRL